MAKAVIGTTKREQIVKSYTDYLLENGQKPESVYSFCKKIKIKEADFYDEFASFSHIESQIWKDMFAQTLANTKAESIYEGYSTREKFLAFYYTWVEILKSNRSFVLLSYQNFEKPIFLKKNTQLADLKFAFLDFANELLLEARTTREVEPRSLPQLMEFYPQIFWTKTLYILDFWINDTSQLFEKTDTLIEKSVNTVFDLLARSPLDSLMDLGKFIFQNRKF